MRRALLCRIYPTKPQKEFLCGQFGAVRFVYNKGLAIKRHFYKVKGQFVSITHDPKKILAIAKKSKK